MLDRLTRTLRRLPQRLRRAANRRRSAIEADYTELASRFGGPLPAAAGDGKRLLIVGLNKWLPQVKTEGLLASAMIPHGYRAFVATSSAASSVHRYHRLFGIQEFVEPRRWSRRVDRRLAANEVDRFLNRRPSFKQVVDFEFRGVQVGRHALSSIVSSLRGGSVEFHDPQVHELLTAELRKGVQLVFAAERLLDHVRPDQILLLERGYTPFGEFYDVALLRGIPAIQFCHSHRRDALLVKRFDLATRNRHPWSPSEDTWRRARELPWTRELDDDLMQEMRGRYENGTWFDRKYLQVGKSLKTPDQVRQQLGLDPAKRTAVVFSHVLWDATFFYGDSLFDDYEQWLVETVKVARDNRSVNWIIKLHPDYVWKMKQVGDTGRPPEYAALESKVGPLPEHVKVLPPQTDISTCSLFPLTDWCITVRGTIGIEMPCFGVPVLTAGTGRYAGLGFTIDSATRDEYLERLRRIEELAPLTPTTIELARRHAFAVFRLRPVPFESFQWVQDEIGSLGHALDHNVTIRARQWDELLNAPDLRHFGDWAATSRTADLLARDLAADYRVRAA